LLSLFTSEFLSDENIFSLIFLLASCNATAPATGQNEHTFSLLPTVLEEENGSAKNQQSASQERD
jgi:hypothetical protein